MAISLIDKIKRAVARDPLAPAFIHDDKVISYQDLQAMLIQVARQLHEQGIRAGQIAGLSCSQSPMHCIALLALARLGAIAVPINPAFSPAIKSSIVAKYGLSVVVSDLDDSAIEGMEYIRLNKPDMQHRAPDLIAYQPEAKTPLLIGIPLLMSMPEAAAKDPHSILYSHGYMIKRMQRTLSGCNSKSRLIPANLNFTMGYICALGMLCKGGTVVFPRSDQAADLISAIRQHAVTHVFFPSQTAIAIDRLLTVPGIAFPSLKHLRILEGTSTPALLDKLRSRFTPHFYISYGSAETGGLTLATPATLKRQPTSSGFARPWVTVEIVDTDDKTLCAGMAGEIRAKGDLLPDGYFMDEAESHKRFRNGWFYTGDRGYLDDAGLLFLE